jgi:hypothetical protein
VNSYGSSQLTEIRKHVFRDLKPYVCTFKECSMMMFRSRNEWFAHELQNHRREWVCQYCQHAPFPTSTTFSKHISSSHPAVLAKTQIEAILLQSEEAVDTISAFACPLCNEWEESVRARQEKQENKIRLLNDGDMIEAYGTRKQFRRHLGRHMEQLALFALPPNDIAMDNDSTDEDDEADSEFDETTDLDSIFPKPFRPEEIRDLPEQFTTEEKSKWELRLRQLWREIDNNESSSRTHMEARRELLKFSNTLHYKILSTGLENFFEGHVGESAGERGDTLTERAEEEIREKKLKQVEKVDEEQPAWGSRVEDQEEDAWLDFVTGQKKASVAFQASSNTDRMGAPESSPPISGDAIVDPLSGFTGEFRPELIRALPGMEKAKSRAELKDLSLELENSEPGSQAYIEARRRFREYASMPPLEEVFEQQVEVAKRRKMRESGIIAPEDSLHSESEKEMWQAFQRPDRHQAPVTAEE